MKKIVYVILGCISLGLGAAGTVLPILPTFPFLLLAAFCFAHGSHRLHRWFRCTKLYQDNLEDFLAGRGMSKKAKVRIMVTVTLLMALGFVMMHAFPIGRIVLACVWIFHLLYFLFGVKTIPKKASACS